MKALKVITILLSLLSISPVKSQNLCINEIQVANIDMFIDPSYNYGGWIEVYNPSSAAISLNDIVIRHTDSEGIVETYTLTINNGVVPAGGYKNIWFDHNASDGNYGPYAYEQVPFKLDADGGIIELLDGEKSHQLIDAVEYPPAIARCSYMRTSDGGDKWRFTSEPTPSRSNNYAPVGQERLAPPVTDKPGGLFSNQAELSVTIPENCILYYTTDCSTPIPGKSLISTDGYFCTDTTTIFRFMLARKGYLNSPVVTRSFIKKDMAFSLPILSVSTHPDNLFDDSIGVYVQGVNGRPGNNQSKKYNQNMDWERPVNMEYFVPENGEWNEALNQEVTFKNFGGWTRFSVGNENFECRTSFKLKANKIYEFNNYYPYPIFSSKPHIKLKSILVRNGGQDPYCRIHDAAIQEMLRTSGVYVDAQAWQPAHIFLNGKYLGMLNIREESNKKFAYSNYGIDDNEIDQWENDWQIKAGDEKKLLEWYNLATLLGASPANDTYWQQISDMVDIEEYLYYMAAEIYIGNKDWLRSGFKNLKGFRARTEDGKFHIVIHDLDAGFRDTDMINQVSKGIGKLVKIFNNMLKNSKFKKQFVDAYCLMGGSIFTPERCKAVLDSMAAITTPALALEGLSPKERVDTLYNRISDHTWRYPTLIYNLKQTLKLAQEWKLAISSNIRNSRLLLNDLEIPTGQFDGNLFPPIRLTASAPAGYVFKEWQVNGAAFSNDSILPVTEMLGRKDYSIIAVFDSITDGSARLACGASPIRINEVSSANDIYINDYFKKSDWVELFNPTDQDIDIAGMYLSDNRDNPQKYQFSHSSGVSTVIPAHGHTIVWCDGKSALNQLHATFKLENADNAFVSLQAEDGSWTDSLIYKAQNRWQTFGRYADSGNYVATFTRPTIGTSNSLTKYTPVYAANENNGSGVGIKPIHIKDTHIVSIEYFNLKGQRLSLLPPHEIVIQKFTYRDGHTESRKVATRPLR